MLYDKKRPLSHTNPKFRAHVRAHEQIISNEIWYGDQPPSLGPGFTAAKTQERANTVVEILLRAAKKAEKTGNTDLAEGVLPALRQD
jgi:hypothetical protein